MGLGCATRILAPSHVWQEPAATLTLQFVTGRGVGDDGFAVDLTEVRLVPSSGPERILRFLPLRIPLDRATLTPLAIPDPAAPVIYREVALRFEKFRRPGETAAAGVVVKRFPIRARTALGRSATLSIALDEGMFGVEQGAMSLDEKLFASVTLVRQGAVVAHHTDAVRIPLKGVPGAKGAALLCTGDAWMVEEPDGQLRNAVATAGWVGSVDGERYALLAEGSRVGGGLIRTLAAGSEPRCLVLESADPGGGGQIVFLARDAGVLHVFAGAIEAGGDVFTVVPVGTLGDRHAPRLVGTLADERYEIVSGPRPAFLPSRGVSVGANR